MVKKRNELSMNVVIITILPILVLVFIAIFFTENSTQLYQAFKNTFGVKEKFNPDKDVCINWCIKNYNDFGFKNAISCGNVKKQEIPNFIARHTLFGWKETNAYCIEWRPKTQCELNNSSWIEEITTQCFTKGYCYTNYISKNGIYREKIYKYDCKTSMIEDGQWIGIYNGNVLNKNSKLVCDYKILNHNDINKTICREK